MAAGRLNMTIALAATEVHTPITHEVWRRAWSPAALGRAATLALHDELALAPKPGLVSFVDAGSHEDMDARTFMRSLIALRGYFVAISALGAQRAAFGQLEALGRQAEATMLAATGGINTHRGAIFMLGLLCAAAATVQAEGQPLHAAAVRAALLQYWGAALAARCDRGSTLPGGRAAARFGLRSASEEAALGLPTLFETTLPAWRHARSQDLDVELCQLQAFFATLAVLDDCNLAHRGGLAGLAFARHEAAAYLTRGGAASARAQDDAWAIHHAFVARRLSPGGCADTLSAACFLHRIGAMT